MEPESTGSDKDGRTVAGNGQHGPQAGTHAAWKHLIFLFFLVSRPVGATLPLPEYRVYTAGSYERAAQSCALAHGPAKPCQELLELAVKLDPKRVSAQWALGILYIQVNQSERAVAALARVLELDPTREDVLLLLGMLYAQQGRPGPARDKLDAYLARHPSSAQGWLELAALQARQGDSLQARSALDRALEADAQTVLRLSRATHLQVLQADPELRRRLEAGAAP